MSGAYYLPSSDDILNDDALAALLQSVVVGLTNFDPTMVRPRWQPQPPTQPPVTTDWCAIGITNYHAFDYPEWTQDADTYGTLHRAERLDVLASFYGPQSSYYASLFKDGLYLQPNSWNYEASGIKLVAADDITHIPELVNSVYIQRSDVPVSFVRALDRQYAIGAIAQVSVQCNMFEHSLDINCTVTVTSTG